MANYDSCDRLYDSSSSSSSKKNPSSSPFKTLHVFLLIGFIILFIGFAAVVVYHCAETKSRPPPNFCINPKTTDSNPLQQKGNGDIWAPNFCIDSDDFELSNDQDNVDTKPPIFNIKSMNVAVPSADQVLNITMSIENPNLGMNISYYEGVVYVYHGTTTLWRTQMKAFKQASWGHRLTRWRFVPSKSLPYNPAAIRSIRDDVTRDGSVVFRVSVQAMLKVYSFEKHYYLLLVDCDGLKVNFPSGTMPSGGRSCQVQLREIRPTAYAPSSHHQSLSMA